MTFPELRPLLDPVTPVTDASPKAFWRFENDLLDTVSVGPFPLSVVAGTETYDSDRNVDRTSFEFDLSTYLAASGYKGIAGSNPRAVSFWVRTSVNESSGNGIMVEWGDSGTGELWRIRIANTPGTVRVQINGANINNIVRVDDNEWHHVVISLESGDTTSDDIKIYIDGVEDAVTSSATVTVDTGASYDVTLGSTFDGLAFFKGSLNEVAIFDGLTAGEVLTIYQGGRTVDELGYSYKESTDTWVSADQPRGGSRYKIQIVALSDQGKIYFGAA